MSNEMVTLKEPLPVPLATTASLRVPLIGPNDCVPLLATLLLAAAEAGVKLTSVAPTSTSITEMPALPNTCVPTAVAAPSPWKPRRPSTFCDRPTLQFSTGVAVMLKARV